MDKWFYLGRYDSPLLCQSFFQNYYNENAFKEARLPLIVGAYHVLDYECFTLEADRSCIANFFYSKMVSGDFSPLFYFVEKASQSAIVVENAKYDFQSLTGFEAFVELVKPMMAFWLAIHFADSGVEKALREKCDATKLDFFTVLSQKAHGELELIQKDRELSRLSLLYKQGKLSNSDLEVFLERFSWTSTHAFMGAPLTSEKLLQELQLFEPRPSAKVEKLDLNWPEVKIANDLAFLRLRFMEVFDKVTFKFWPLLQKIGVERGLSFEEVCAHTYGEVLALDFKPRSEIVQRIEKRGLLVDREGSERVLIGKELEIEQKKHLVKVENTRELVGLSACRGKVTGIAKVVLLMKEMTKVKKGDVLIACETTPEYISAMKLAAAIVTDKGGVTSHAAIVSRELGVPCVIGTKFATRIFKDGDLVEVNAEKGIVKLVT